VLLLLEEVSAGGVGAELALPDEFCGEAGVELVVEPVVESGVEVVELCVLCVCAV